MSDFLCKIPIMPLREVVMFPKGIFPLFVGREFTIKTVMRSINHHDRRIFMVSQRDASIEHIETRRELFTVGTVSRILQAMRLPDGSLKVLFEGIHRATFMQKGQQDPRYASRKVTSLAAVYPFEEISYLHRETEQLYSGDSTGVGKILQPLGMPTPGLNAEPNYSSRSLCRGSSRDFSRCCHAVFESRLSKETTNS